MFQALARFAVRRRLAVMVAALLFALYGWSAFRQLPIEAFPDVTDPMVEVVGLYPGQAAEEVEKRVTLELERVLAGTPRLVDLRSVSVFGLTLVTLTFEENTPDFELRTLVAERLRDADLPDGAETVMWAATRRPWGRSPLPPRAAAPRLCELRAIQDFVVERACCGPCPASPRS